MACTLLGAQPLHKPMLTYYQLDSKDHIFQWNFVCNLKVFIKKNTVEDGVCKNGGHFFSTLMYGHPLETC